MFYTRLLPLAFAVLVPTVSAATLIAASPSPGPAPAPAGGEGVVVTGITEPFRNVVLKSGGKRNPPFSGKIAKVLAQEGDVVQEGEIVIELDRTEEELEARVRRLIADSKAELRSAYEKERTLGALLDASRKLYLRTKSISLEDLERKELEWRLATAERMRLEVVKEREKFEADLSEASLLKRTLRTPIAGTVVKVFLREGESCEPVDPLIQIADTTRGVFVGNVEEKLGRTLEREQKVPLRIQTGTAVTEIEGTIKFVSPVVDPASGLMQVKVEFANLEGTIRPGVPGAMVVPQRAK